VVFERGERMKYYYIVFMVVISNTIVGNFYYTGDKVDIELWKKFVQNTFPEIEDRHVVITNWKELTKEEYIYNTKEESKIND
jgi:magnesium-transporting ATPase (P-type)